MHLVEILLPLRDRSGRPIERARYDELSRALVARFGGVTAFLRAPAQGRWRDDEGDVERDEVVVIEVLAPRLEYGYWRDLRRWLEVRFDQREIVVRATPCRRL